MQMSVHGSPKSRSRVSVQVSKSMTDGLINEPFHVVQLSGEQSQRKRELSLITSESEVELADRAGRRSNIKRQKLRLNRSQEMVENSVKVEQIVNPNALPPSRLFCIRSPLSPKVNHTPNKPNQMGAHVYPKSGSQVAVQES